MLEICIDSLASARAAIEGGADRLELCGPLTIGGVTPYGQLLRQIRRESSIEIRCMIRPRAGDFLYSPEETELMQLQIRELAPLGADGFVTGCLTEDGVLDEEMLQKLMETAPDKKWTLHRAIDVSRDPEDTYRRAAKLGFDTVLTSGGAASCTGGKEMIGRLLQLRRELNGPEVLIGAGVNADVIRAMRRQFPDAGSFHMSGKTEVESAMRWRRRDIPMGLPGLDEWHIQQTDLQAVRRAGEALKENF